MQRHDGQHPGKGRKQGGSARFLITLVIALVLAGVGFWMASRKSAQHQPASSSDPLHPADSQRTAAVQNPVPLPQPNPSPVPPPTPAPTSSHRSRSAPALSASATDALPGARQSSTRTEADQGDPNVLHRVTLSGTATETRQYCGGANPSDEILETLQRPRPLARHKLFLRRGSKNVLAHPVLLEFSTDADGKFQIELPEGEYCLIEEGKKGALKIPDFSEENRKLAQAAPSAMPYKLTSPNCLSDWWQTCDKVLRIGKQSVTGIKIEFHRGCRPPCVEGGPDVL